MLFPCPEKVEHLIEQSFFRSFRLKKSLPCVHFINILCTNFLYECCFSSFFYVHVTRGKLPKWHSYKKFVRKILMKLTACALTGDIIHYFRFLSHPFSFRSELFYCTYIDAQTPHLVYLVNKLTFIAQCHRNDWTNI